MTTSAATHSWLPRLSDYHSGAASATERVAVEAHLATCALCQRALADYRRLYTLAAAPLRLGAPSARALAGRPMRDGSNATNRHPLARRAGILAAAAVIAGFVVLFASILAHTPTRTTTLPQPTTLPKSTPVVQPTPTGTPLGTGTPMPAPFVCANPAGSTMTYAYVDAQNQIAQVTGCQPPVELTHFTFPASSTPFSQPVAWSPSNRLLAVSTNQIPSTNGPGDNIIIIDTVTHAFTATNYGYYDVVNSTGKPFTVHQFIGFVDDQSFLGAIMAFSGAGTGTATVGPTRIVRVNIATHQETPVAALTWVAATEIRAGYLYYGGYASASEGGAYLHRVSLTTGRDQQLVPLGIAGDNGCMAGPPCTWTAPWDVTPDGTKVVYHNPGPASTPSDTNTPKDTPLLAAGIDGSGPVTLFSGVLAGELRTPYIAPSGALVLSDANPASGSAHTFVVQALSGGPVTTLTTLEGYAIGWRGDSQAIFFMTTDSQNQPAPVLITLADHKVTYLTQGTSSYLWGH